MAGEAVEQLICDGVDIDNAVAGQGYLAVHRQSGGGKEISRFELRCHSISIEGRYGGNGSVPWLKNGGLCGAVSSCQCRALVHGNRVASNGNPVS